MHMSETPRTHMRNEKNTGRRSMAVVLADHGVAAKGEHLLPGRVLLPLRVALRVAEGRGALVALRALGHDPRHRGVGVGELLVLRDEPDAAPSDSRSRSLVGSNRMVTCGQAAVQAASTTTLTLWPLRRSHMRLWFELLRLEADAIVVLRDVARGERARPPPRALRGAG